MNIGKKTKLYIILGVVLLSFIIGLTVVLVKNNKKHAGEASSVIAAIPTDAIAIIQVNRPFDFVSDIDSSKSHWNWLLSFVEVDQFTSVFNGLKSHLLKDDELINFLTKKPLFVSLHSKGNGVDALYCFDNGDFDASDLEDVFVEKMKLQVKRATSASSDIQAIIMGNKQIFWACKKGISLFSCNQELLQKGLDQLSSSNDLFDNENFERIYKTAGKNASCNIFLHSSALDVLSASVLAPGLNGRFFSDNWKGWTALDYEPQGNVIQMSGFSNFKDGYLSVFSGNKSSGNDLIGFVPEKTLMYVHYSVSDIPQFLNKYDKYANRINSSSYNSFSKAIKERLQTTIPTFFSFLGGEMVYVVGNYGSDSISSMFMMNVQNPDSVASIMSHLEQDSVSSLKKKTIDGDTYYICENGLWLTSYFKSLIAMPQYKVYSFVDDVLVLAMDEDQILDLRQKVKNDQVLTKNHDYSLYQDQLSSDANITFCAKSISAMASFSSSWSSGFSKWISRNIQLMGNMSFMSAQLTSRDDKFYTHIGLLINGCDTLKHVTQMPMVDTVVVSEKIEDTISVSKEKITEDESVVWSYKLGANIKSDLNIIGFSSGSKNKLIMVQDEANTVYLMKMNGEQLWNKKVDGLIKSDFFIADISKNGKNYLMFSTDRSIYAFDLNGALAKGYPRLIKGGLSNGISVFDYENKKDYRVIYCTPDKKVHYENMDGSDVKGWGFVKTNDLVNNAVQFFRTSKKDLIVVRENSGKMYLLSRKGEVVATINDKIKCQQKHSIFLTKYNGQQVFSVLADDGSVKLWSIDGKSISFSSKFSSQNNGFMSLDANNNSEFEFLFFKNNKLTYTDTKDKVLFETTISGGMKYLPRYINWKSGVFSVATTDGKVFLIDKSGKILNGFPLVGQTNSVIYDADSDGKFDVIFGNANLLKCVKLK